MRKLYLTVAIPKFTYGAGLWFRPTFTEGTNRRHRGSIGVAKRLASIQRLANISISGAMRTTASDTLDTHMLLLPTHLLLQKVCHRAALRLASLPQRHPLFKHIRHAAKHIGVLHHRSSIHNLLATFRAFPDEVETIDTVNHKIVAKSTPYAPHIAIDKDSAIKEHDDLEDEIRIYSDGSAHSGGVGAAAILIRPGKEPRSLAYHLGLDKHHSVRSGNRRTHIGSKVTLHRGATIDPGLNICRQQSGNSIRMTKTIAKKYRDQDSELQLTVRWIPGHAGVHGNELADEEAKKAAESPHNSSARRLLPRYLQIEPLPHSISALKQWHQSAPMEKWKEDWALSPRYIRTKAIDPNIPSSHFLKLIDPLPKKCASMYIQLRTGHAPLNSHLNRLGKSDSPDCIHCAGTEETVHHFLLDCPHYARERHIMAIALRRDASSIRFLLTNEKATKHLFRYVNSSGRLKPTFGEISIK